MHNYTVAYELKIDPSEMGPNGPKTRFFHVLSKPKVSARNFSSFLHEVTAAKRLKINENDFFENNFVSKFLIQKFPKMGLKMAQNKIF